MNESDILGELALVGGLRVGAEPGGNDAHPVAKGAALAYRSDGHVDINGGACLDEAGAVISFPEPCHRLTPAGIS